MGEQSEAVREHRFGPTGRAFSLRIVVIFRFAGGDIASETIYADLAGQPRQLGLLYDNPVSSNALTVRFLLAALGLAYRRVHADGELRIGESNAILRYLAVREGRDDLYPSEPAARARVDWALDTWSLQIRPRLLALELVALLYHDEEGGGGVPEEADPGRVAAALDPARDALAELDGFTLADCAATPALWRSKRLPLDLGAWPKARELRARLTAHPAFEAAGPVA